MSKRIIIGITGKINSGKSLCSHLIQLKHANFIEYSVSEPLKQIATIFGFEHQEVYGTQAQKQTINDFWGISGRTFLQTFGTNICREVLPQHMPSMSSVWCQLLRKKIGDTTTNIIIPDVRFKNEADIIKELGGWIIHVDRPGNNSYQSSHKSETEMTSIPPDFTINNDSDVKHVSDQLENIILNLF